MNPKLKIGTKTIPVWFLLLGMVAAGSLSIAVQGIDPSQEQKFQIEQNTKPKTNSFVFTGLPVEFDRDNEANLRWTGFVSTGVKILTNQKITFNVMTDVGEEAELSIPLVNNSEDGQIVNVQCTAPEQVVLDIEIPDASSPITTAGIDAVRLVSQNNWLVNVKPGLVGPPGLYVGNMEIAVATEHAGAFSVMCQLLAVG